MLAFFNKKMSDKDFKMMLEAEGLEQKEAKANMGNFTLPLDNNGVKKAPMVLTPEELLGVEPTVTGDSDLKPDTINMESGSETTENFLFKKMMEAREEQTKVATTKPEEPVMKIEKEASKFDPNESIEDMLKRMEQKAQEKVNSLYGYTEPVTKTEPVVTTPIKQEVSSTLDGILNDILEPKKEEPKEDITFNIESLINDMKADVGIYNKEESVQESKNTFSAEATNAIEQILEETVEEETVTLTQENETADNIQQENQEIIDIISDEEFVDAEDIVDAVDTQPTEQFETNIFTSIKEPDTYEDISSDYEDDEDEEDDEKFEAEYYSSADKEKTLKFIKKGKVFSIISFILGLAALVLAFLGEIVLKDMGANLLLASAATFALSVAFNLNLLKAFGRMFTGKATPDFAVATASILAAIYNFVYIYMPTLNLIPLFIASALPLVLTELIRLGKYSRINRSFRLISANGTKNALVFSENENAKKEAASIASFDEANVCLTKKAENIVGFIKNTYSKESSGYTTMVISLFGLAFAIAAAVGGYFSEAISPISCFMATMLLVATPAALLITELPLKLANNRLKFYGSAIFGERSCGELDNTNCVNIDIADVFPEGTVKLIDFKLLSPNPIDQTLLDAAALTKVAKSPLAGIFKQITDETEDTKELPVDTVVYEERMGISGWVDDRRVFVGNRTLMEAHGFRVPSLDVDKKVLQRGYFPIYLGSENVLCALLIVKYTAHPDVALELKRLAATGTSIFINNCDQNVTGEMVEDYLGLYEDSVYITTRSMQNAFDKETEYAESVTAPVVVGDNVCGHISTITAAIKIKKLTSVISVFYCILTICLLAGLVTAIFLGQFSFITSIVIAASTLLSTLLCALPAYISRP